jgi:hypothetical protein
MDYAKSRFPDPTPVTPTPQQNQHLRSQDKNNDQKMNSDD